MAGEAAAKKTPQGNVVPLAQIPMGLTCKGLIMEKHHGTNRDGDSIFHLSVAVKGLKTLLKIKVTEDVFLDSQEMTPYENSVTFNEFNGGVYWQESKV